METCRLLDDRSRPDVRAEYGRLARESDRLDAAVTRIRLGGMTLEEGELGKLARIRLLLGEMNAMTLSLEAEAMAADPERTTQLHFLANLFQRGSLDVRISPLSGWNPDFSVFSRGEGARSKAHSSEGDGAASRPVGHVTALFGPHWFVRPYPHPGPAFVVVLRGEPALRARDRFDESWQRGHDIRGPLLSLITEAIRRGTRPSPDRLTPTDGFRYSLSRRGPHARVDPV